MSKTNFNKTRTRTCGSVVPESWLRCIATALSLVLPVNCDPAFR